MSEDQKPSKLCRICLTADVRMYVSIFDNYREFTIADYVLLITSVDIKEEDGLPNKICSTCFVELEAALAFKQKCENTDQFLKTGKEKIIEACAIADMQDIIIVKKEEPYEEEIKYEEAVDDSVADEYYGIETLEDNISINEVVPFKSRVIDLRLECHDCGNLFKSKCKLRVHWKKTHMLPSLICGSCKRQFKTYRAYHTHKKKSSKSCMTAANSYVTVEGQGKFRVFHCKECSYKSRRIKDIQMHILVHSGDKPYQCIKCQKQYSQQSSLQSHMEAKHEQFLKEITCHVCGKQIQGRSKIYRHMLSHMAKEPCPVCKKLVSKRNLKQHMLRHKDTKSYTCEKCASTFYTLAELCNHRRWVHNKIKDAYKCDVCGYTASRSDRIKTHKANHTDSNVPCVTCGMFFPNVQKMEAHRKCHDTEKTNECPYCEIKFYRMDSVGKHIRKKHRQVLEAIKEEASSISSKVKQGKTQELFKIKVCKKFKQEEG